MGGPNSLFAGLGTPPGFPGISPLGPQVDPLRNPSVATSLSSPASSSASAPSTTPVASSVSQATPTPKVSLLKRSRLEQINITYFLHCRKLESGMQCMSELPGRFTITSKNKRAARRKLRPMLWSQARHLVFRPSQRRPHRPQLRQ